jgi:hypothetical protein
MITVPGKRERWPGKQEQGPNSRQDLLERYPNSKQYLSQRIHAIQESDNCTSQMSGAHFCMDNVGLMPGGTGHVVVSFWIEQS